MTVWWYFWNLHGSDVFTHRQKLCKPEIIFKSTQVNFFYSKNMMSFLNYVTAMLRDLSAWHSSYNEKNEEIWLSPMTKAPTPTEKAKKQCENTQTPPKTSISQPLRTNNSHPTSVTPLNRFMQWTNKKKRLTGPITNTTSQIKTRWDSNNRRTDRHRT